ncbi:pentatricopeptide repeat-containing protein At3g14730 [Impatiens glandulifera]|uniref:pentatricopeptide repeat-containing protein At3g14730 n=1 Tax=Impatiens glandulifera TaxID=253017 RepID=UPI001FB0F930|nr:pentatricopeptide repeat-containing protein At3g14730 [Impatiens glandulifera]
MNKATIFKGFIKLRPQFHTILNFSSSSATNQWIPTITSSCITSLQLSAQERNLTKGKELHSYILRNGFTNSPLFTTSLINMYSKCNQIRESLFVFDTSIHCRNVFVYNAIISGLVSNGLPRNAIEIYNGMQQLDCIMPDKFTFPCVIKAFSEVNQVIDVMKIHGLVFKFGLEFDVYIGSALSHCYLKIGLINSADKVFVEMPTRDVVLWNAMINGYAQIGQHDRALQVFGLMVEQGFVPSRFTVTGILSAFASNGDLKSGMAIHGFVIKMNYDSGVAVSNALIDIYGKCKRLEDAKTVFNVIHEKDVFSWNSIICVHEQCGDHDETLRHFYAMLRAGVKPDLVTITTVLPACARLAAINRGKEIHAYTIVNGLENDFCDMNAKNAIIDMYAKCGSMRDARLVFDQTSRKDLASWNIMIMGYGIHGLGEEAIRMFHAMRETRLDPDEITFVGILSACSHAGLLSQGREFFANMQTKFGITPTVEHYTCMVDLLGRAGELNEAYELISKIRVEINPIVWRAFLAACRLHGNTDLAEIATKRICELDPYHCGSYVLMSNIYGAIGRYDEVSHVRHSMRGKNVRKTLGCSWIELGNGVRVFSTGDRTHPEDSLIYALLNSLTTWIAGSYLVLV